MTKFFPLIVTLASVLLAPPAFSADPVDPVRTVMAVAGWQGEGQPAVDAQDYFDENLLGSIYSASFVEVYRLAQKVDELQDGQGYMTGYDVVIGGQDSCPLKDVRFETRPAIGAVTPVAVYFDASSCFGNPPNLKEPMTIFHVIEQNGRYVIDNFWNHDYGADKLDTSVKAEYAALTHAYLDFLVTGSWPKQ
ncbi:hypothetical protein ASE36_09295 [Rhizobium sp. Root274]|uniref:hypothetical protein n=1 Tax=unclassified Rhizobium TaxID=2613769 RepID=UPI000712A046|nr:MULTISPECIES: hypothetical protein [unclassified Rhizobium]KQW28686.1 hypothetical protein ASC71_09310 [Rhizobium sp. Root1240]KRD28884.1 hypothetical protein ASE36_09295 [Rhizobium sp. Root274]